MTTEVPDDRQDPANLDISAVEMVLIRRRLRTEDAIRFYNDLKQFHHEIEQSNKHSKDSLGMPTRQITEALALARRDAYEEILLWKTARAEMDRRIEAYSPAAKAARKHSP